MVSVALRTSPLPAGANPSDCASPTVVKVLTTSGNCAHALSHCLGDAARLLQRRARRQLDVHDREAVVARRSSPVDMNGTRASEAAKNSVAPASTVLRCARHQLHRAAGTAA